MRPSVLGCVVQLAERAGVIDAMDGVREICDTILVVPARRRLLPCVSADDGT